jgi:hypothetical protein
MKTNAQAQFGVMGRMLISPPPECCSITRIDPLRQLANGYRELRFGTIDLRFQHVEIGTEANKLPVVMSVITRTIATTNRDGTVALATNTGRNDSWNFAGEEPASLAL